MSTKKKKSKSQSWMDDGDDAHFSDNPAVPKATRKKWRAEERKLVAGKKASETKKTSVKPFYGKRGMVSVMGPDGSTHWDRKAWRKNPTGKMTTKKRVAGK